MSRFSAGVRVLGAVFCATVSAADARAQRTDTTPPAPAARPSLYTAAQAARGEQVYINVCVECHEKLEYTGPDFRVKWNGRAAFDLVDLLRTTMPDSDPGILPAQDYVDVVAYMMKLNGVLVGKTALPLDDAALKTIKIEIPK